MEPTPAATAPEPAKKTSPAVLAVCALVLVFAIDLRIKQAVELRTPLVAEATLRGRTFQIEVADTPVKREVGLGERDSLAEGHGMYFPFGTSQRWVFWMKGMRFPIDIIWISEGKVIGIEHSVPPPTTFPLDTFSPIVPADAVLELNAGVAKELGLRPGDDVCLGACPPAAAPAAIVLEALPEAPPDTKKYLDEDAAPGAYANAELGLGFSYPETWGEAFFREETAAFDTGSRLRAVFTATTSPWIDILSPDWMSGGGEGWNGHLLIKGDPMDPLGSLTEARSRVDAGVACGAPPSPCTVSFKTLANGYRFGYQSTYGETGLSAIYLAPGLLREGAYRDVQIVAFVTRLEPENEKEWYVTAKEADAAMAAPGVKERLDEIEKAFVSMRRYEGETP